MKLLPPYGPQHNGKAEFHSSAAGGHFGFFHTSTRLSALVYWDRIKRDVQ